MNTASFSDLRFRGRPSAIALAAVLFLEVILDVPPWERRGSTASLFLEEAISYGTLVASAVAALSTVAFTVRPVLRLANVYSRSALCVVAGNASLLILGYWRNPSDITYGYYGLARPLIAMSVIATTPALLALIAHFIQRRAD